MTCERCGQPITDRLRSVRVRDRDGDHYRHVVCPKAKP